MAHTHLLLRYGELFLKGKNRHFFEKALVQNIQRQIPGQPISTPHSRLLMDYFPHHHQLRRIFGLTSYSPCIQTQKDIHLITQIILEIVKDLPSTSTFRIDTNRSDKQFPLTSPQINRLIGEQIEQTTSLTFSLKQASTIINIEIGHDAAYIFTQIIPCAGGLPTGVEGQVFLLIENPASLLAGLSIMKRGCNLIPLGFQPQDLSLLQKYSPIPLKLQLIKNFPEIEQLAHRKILISGQHFETYKKYDTSIMVLRPLIAYSQTEINSSLELFQRI